MLLRKLPCVRLLADEVDQLPASVLKSLNGLLCNTCIEGDNGRRFEFFGLSEYENAVFTPFLTGDCYRLLPAGMRVGDTAEWLGDASINNDGTRTGRRYQVKRVSPYSYDVYLEGF
jgi:hypothetical protein